MTECEKCAAERALRVQIERERLETSRQVTALQAEVRELYGRLAEVRELQRSLETLIVAGVAALEAVDRLGLRAPETSASPPLLSWLRGVLAPKGPRDPRSPRY
jgi:signal transduction protein with GAF and PtsI domain